MYVTSKLSWCLTFLVYKGFTMQGMWWLDPQNVLEYVLCLAATPSLPISGVPDSEGVSQLSVRAGR